MRREPLFVLSNKVVKGVSRGKKIGFPTANIDYPQKEAVKIDFGVYAITAKLNNHQYKGVANVGAPLTFFDEKPRIDIHLFNFHKEIYGEKITVMFWKKLREVKRFSSEQKLIWQIEDDVKKANEYLAPMQAKR